jgi:hypothetical protein
MAYDGTFYTQTMLTANATNSPEAVKLLIADMVSRFDLTDPSLPDDICDTLEDMDNLMIALKEKEKRLYEKRKAVEEMYDEFKERLLAKMKAANYTQLNSPDAINQILISKTKGKVVFTDESVLPDKYKMITIKAPVTEMPMELVVAYKNTIVPNLTLIAEDINRHKISVPGATVEKSEYIKIA